MASFSTVLALHLRGAVATRRLVLFVLVFVFLAVLSAATGRWGNELISAALGADALALLPEPSYASVWQQWVKNLSQIGTLMVTIAVAYDVHAALYTPAGRHVLTRPVSRTAIVTAPLASAAIIGAVAAAVGGGVTVISAYLLFPDVHVASVLAATGLWFVATVMFGALGVLVAVTIRSLIGAIATTLGLYLIGAALGAVPWLARHSPFGLMGAAGEIVADDGRPLDVAGMTDGSVAIRETWGASEFWWQFGGALLVIAAALVVASIAVCRKDL